MPLVVEHGVQNGVHPPSSTMPVGRIVGIVGANRKLGTEPLIKSGHAGRHIVRRRIAFFSLAAPFRTHRAKVPLTEVPGGIPFVLKELSKRDLLFPQVPNIGVMNPNPRRMPPRQAACTRRRTNRRGGVVAGQDHATRGHRIEVRSLEIRVPVETRIAPTQVVRHAEDDVGWFCGGLRLWTHRRASGEQQDG